MQASNIVNTSITYVLDAWPKDPTNNFKFKNYLFGATSVVKILIKKSMCIVAMEYHLIVQLTCDIDTARYAIIFGVDNSPSSHADNYKNNFLKLEEGPTF